MMAGQILAESSDVFDQDTGVWLGVINRKTGIFQPVSAFGAASAVSVTASFTAVDQTLDFDNPGLPMLGISFTGAATGGVQVEDADTGGVLGVFVSPQGVVRYVTVPATSTRLRMRCTSVGGGTLTPSTAWST